MPIAISSVVGWLHGTLLGTIAITSSPSIGYLMLTGRVDVRRAALEVFRCFIIFGASTTPSSIVDALNCKGAPASEVAAATPPPPVLPQPPVTPRPIPTPTIPTPDLPFRGAPDRA